MKHFGCVRRADWQLVTGVLNDRFKRQYVIAHLQGETSQKTWILSNTAVRSSNIAPPHLPAASVVSRCNDTVGFPRRTHCIYFRP
jgi:hypothetical protein